MRHGLCADLAFSPKDRVENIRRVGEMAKLFTEAGVIALKAFISPYITDRNRVRVLVAPERFIEIYCCCALEVCEQRDVKRLMRRQEKCLSLTLPASLRPMNLQLSQNFHLIQNYSI